MKPAEIQNKETGTCFKLKKWDIKIIS